MEIPSQMKNLLELTSDGKIWIYIAVFFITMYLLISLLTWSFKKPLKYLGIPTIGVGILFLVLRFVSPLFLNMLDLGDEVNIIKVVLPGVLKPVLFCGLLSLLGGIIMIVLYKVLNKNIPKEEQKLKTTKA